MSLTRADGVFMSSLPGMRSLYALDASRVPRPIDGVSSDRRDSSEVIAELAYLVRWERWRFGQYGLTDRVRTRCEFSDVLGQVENHASVIDNDNP